MYLEFYVTTILGVLLPSGLTIFSCLWLFFKYFMQKRKNMAFSLVVILALSDFLFSLIGVMTTFFPLTHLSGFYHITLFLTSYFSIFWASAISYIVYKSLKERDFNSSALVMKNGVLILIVSSLFAFWYILYFSVWFNYDLVGILKADGCISNFSCCLSL